MARRNTGGVFLRDGRFYHKVKRGREWVKISLHTSDRETALTRKRDFDTARSKGVPVSPLVGRVTFDQMVEYYQQDYENADQTAWASVARRLKKLARVFGGRPLAEISVLEIDAYKAARRKTISETGRPFANGTINRELAALRRLFRLANEKGLLAYTPKIKMLGDNSIRQGFFSKEEFIATRDNLESPLNAIVSFAYLTGWRVRDEILTLQWKYVDFEANEVRLPPGSTKNREGRVFPLTPDLRDLLTPLHAEYVERCKRGQHEPHVFVRIVERKGGRTGARVRARAPEPVRSFFTKWKRAVRLAGCPDRIPHDLRRTAVRNMVRSGVPERVCMALVGHKTRDIFDRYNITAKTDGDLAREALAGQLPTLPPMRDPRAVRREARAAARGLSLVATPEPGVTLAP